MLGYVGRGSQFIFLTLFVLLNSCLQVCLFAFCLGASMRVRPSAQYSWLHHLVLVFLTGFAGGTIIPMFFGRTPVLFVNDLLVPLVCLSWYLVHYTRVGGLLQTSPCKFLLVALFEIYRAASILKTVGQAATDIAPGPYYPIAVVGPVLVGTLSGSMGAFMPPDRGISFLATGVPLNLQTTLLACLFYHLAAHDPALPGAYLRGLPALRLSDPENLKALTVFFFVAMAFLSLVKGPDYNPFTPVHTLLYQVLGIPYSPATLERLKSTRRASTAGDHGPKPAVKASGRLLGASKVLVPLLAVLAYQLQGKLAPRTTLPVGGRLNPGEYIAACGPLQSFTGHCKQHFLTLDAEGRLSLYRGASPKDTGSQRLWQSKATRRSGKLNEAGLFAELKEGGVLVLKHTAGGDATYWTSSSRKTEGEKKGQEAGRLHLRVLERGAFGIFEGSTPLWTSDGILRKDTA